MIKLAIIKTDENDDVSSIVKEYFNTDPETFDRLWNEANSALSDWALLTKTINYGIISYLHAIGALWIDENNEFQVDFKNFTVASVIDGLLSNEPYLPEEMTTHFGYIIVKKAIKQLKKLFPKGRALPIDIGAGVQHLQPLLPTYIAYSRKDPEMARLFDTLLPQIETFMKPLTKTADVSAAD